MQLNIITYIAFVLTLYIGLASAYTPFADANILSEYRKSLQMQERIARPKLNHALIARKLVHEANWSAMGTISTNMIIKGYPMVNIISINDNDINGTSTGHIQFLLTDLDFTGPDWETNNKVTLMFTDEQEMHCSHRSPHSVDPMEPTCARTMISGEIKKMDTNASSYEDNLKAFVKRHPSAENWLRAHAFYLCELEIKNIFVLDFYGGPHNIKPEDYYNVEMPEKITRPKLNHALIARKLVNQVDWSPMGTISTNAIIKDYPMVNIISINDNDINGNSTGHIQFLLTDLDFTGPDWETDNKVTLLFTDEQEMHCSHNSTKSIDPMEPTCARTMISGEIKKMDTNAPGYENSLKAFVMRHPSAQNWLRAHAFYLCELEIKNIFVLDFYGGPHNVKPDDYYNVQM